MAWGPLFLSFRRPSPEQQRACVSSAGAFNYPSEFHCSTAAEEDKDESLKKNGFFTNRSRVQLGVGSDAFHLAKSALLSWKHFTLGWANVNPKTPVEKGTRFCVCVKELVPWIMMPLQIVYVSNAVNRAKRDSFSFGSGTLQGHLLAGEERFSVEWDKDDKVWYEIISFSKPAHILSFIGYPYVRLRQKYFTQQSTQAMLTYVSSHNTKNE
ncbi:hypothetical protein LUZ60_014512 [Juncus effusus]|nr:hypothetical protein LUZ60_014512 [Juncus effusus]